MREFYSIGGEKTKGSLVNTASLSAITKHVQEQVTDVTTERTECFRSDPDDVSVSRTVSRTVHHPE